MGKIITGPINMNQVIDFTRSITESFYEYSYPDVNPVFWEKDTILYEVRRTRGMLPEKGDFRKLYDSADSRTLAKIAANAPEFAVSLNVSNFKGRFDFRTRIYNQTMLEDAISGQTFPATIKKFALFTKKINCSQSWVNQFIAYRNKMIDQAQERIDQSVSGAAYNIMNDLHS